MGQALHGITIDEIAEEFEFLGDAAAQYNYLIEIGRELPRLPESQKTEKNRVHGCQSHAWLVMTLKETDPPVVEIQAESVSEIVSGLLVVLLAVYAKHTPQEILDADIKAVFQRLQLDQHISPQRKNGLSKMIGTIREFARKSLVDEGLPIPKSPSACESETNARLIPARNFDVDAVRADYPILNQKLESGFPVTFLDSGASAQKPQVVIDKEKEVYEQYFANAYRGVYEFGARVDEELENSRTKVQQLLNANESSEIIFTSGTTMSINLVARAWGAKCLKPGEEILLTEMEHHANLVPWQIIANETGAKIKYIPMTDDLRLDLDQLDSVITEKTKIASVVHMSNMLGTINPIDEIIEKAHQVGAVVMVDAAQSVPHQLVDVQKTDVDFLAFSGHKIFGPTGVGVLYGKRRLLEDMDPFLGGGHMIERVELDHSTWADIPAKYEAGTLPIAQAIALGTAVDYVSQFGFDAIHQHETELLEYATRELSKIEGLKIYGPAIEHKGPIISFTIEGTHAEDLAQLLNLRGVFVRHGHHCTMPLHKKLGIEASVRASFAMYNTKSDVDALCEGLKFALEQLRKG